MVAVYLNASGNIPGAVMSFKTGGDANGQENIEAV